MKLWEYLFGKADAKDVFDDEFKRQLGWSPDEPSPLEDVSRDITVMVSRIDFSGVNIERMKVEELRRLQDTHLNVVSDAVARNGGEVNVVLQDRVICLFNAWIPNGQATLHAAQTAIEVLEHARFNVAKGGISATPVRICIGIDEGCMLRACIGNERRKASVVFGEAAFCALKFSEKKHSKLVVSEKYAEKLKQSSIKIDWTRIEIVEG